MVCSCEATFFSSRLTVRSITRRIDCACAIADAAPGAACPALAAAPPRSESERPPEASSPAAAPPSSILARSSILEMSESRSAVTRSSSCRDSKSSPLASASLN